MIVDASALLAIVRGEPLAPRCFQALLGSPLSRISAANWFEAALVVDGLRDPEANRDFEELVEGFAIVIEPVTVNQVRLARDAYRRFGRGRGHPARLNFGDCFAYALAKESDEPLLFVGQDFAQTDLRSVLT